VVWVAIEHDRLATASQVSSKGTPTGPSTDDSDG
jgi:hypothetical protein